MVRATGEHEHVSFLFVSVSTPREAAAWECMVWRGSRCLGCCLSVKEVRGAGSVWSCWRCSGLCWPAFSQPVDIDCAKPSCLAACLEWVAEPRWLCGPPATTGHQLESLVALSGCTGGVFEVGCV